MQVIDENGLDEFRRTWSGERTLGLLKETGGKMFVSWPVGLGKSTNIDDLIEVAVNSAAYDLIIALFPTRRIIDERRWILSPPPNIKIVNLEPRPYKQCGAAANEEWKKFEAADLGMMGRVEICGNCPHRKRCPWPEQYGAGLKGSRVIFATQSHLHRSSGFIHQLTKWVGAERVLVILDEVGLLACSFRKTINFTDLSQYVEAIKQMDSSKWKKVNDELIYKAGLLCQAPTADLQCAEWRMPYVSPEWTLAAQKKGIELYGDKFRYLGFDLQQFGVSPVASRERLDNGNVAYATIPDFGCDLVVYSGTANPDFITYRLGLALTNPFAGYVFRHTATSWFNIASTLGTRRHFKKNATQILDFYAQLLVRRINEGRRPLLIAKKCFVKFCAEEVSKRLKEFGIKDARIVTGKWSADELAQPRVIPLIHYGMIGTNLFEHFDCAYCLTSYYVDESVVDLILQDQLASDQHLDIKITTAGRPRRRTAGVTNPRHRIYDVHALAQRALEQQEIDRVAQTVGRVRPFTRPREIITFQCAANPYFEYTAEFNSIGEAREHFKILGRRDLNLKQRIDRISELRNSGLSQKEVLGKIDVSLRTVKRYWNKDGCHQPFLNIYKGFVAPGGEL